LKEVCERRGKQADVTDFVPNDLSRSAEALVQHRKAVKKREAKLPQHSPETVEQLLFSRAGSEQPTEQDGEAIRFPFLGLGS
ncbi:MAG: hypothetical protein VCB25_02495, partial [Myxococcota bacterium]